LENGPFFVFKRRSRDMTLVIFPKNVTLRTETILHAVLKFRLFSGGKVE